MAWKAYDSNGSLLEMALTDLPVGTIVGTGRSSAPTNWVLCDGTAYDRIAYAELFGAIGTDYGVGDGSTTFNVPSIDGHMILASSNSARFGINDGSYLPNNVISTDKLQDSAVTTAKVNNSAITTAKLNDSSVTTAKITDSNVTAAKLTAGTVVQVATRTTNTSQSWPSNTNPDPNTTDCYCTITPLFASSRLYIILTASTFCESLSSGDTGYGAGIYSSLTSSIIRADSHIGGSYFAAAGGARLGYSINVSPNSTASQTYYLTLEPYSNNAGTRVYLNRNYQGGSSPYGDTSTMTIMEIKQ